MTGRRPSAWILETGRDCEGTFGGTGRPRHRSENLAAVLFSSGSTGKPKAIRRLHRGHRFNPSIRSTFQLCESDRHILKTSLDSSLLFLEIFWPLLTGGRMIIAPTQENGDTAALLKVLIDHKITIIALVPSLLRLLVAEDGLEACTSLRHMLCFGEPLPADVEERFCHRLSAALGIFYGTTEAPALAFRQCRGWGPRPLGNLGYRLGNSQIYVLDARACSQCRLGFQASWSRAGLVWQRVT